MHIRVEPRCWSPNEQYDLLIATTEKDAVQSAPGSVSTILGTDTVTIVGNVPGLNSTIEIKGRENLQLLRDAMNEICKQLDIL